jgi:virginiamycin A acetyltransferase
MALPRLLGRIRRLWAADEFTSLKLREEFESKYGIVVGLYSYGCFAPGRIDRNTTIGRYCSFAQTSVVLNRNHPTDFLSTTPYLFNSRLGMVEVDAFPYSQCEIGDDVWLGHNSVVTASARRVGRGAVIAAGAVVTQDVAPYTIVAGVPARVVRQRFADDVIEKVEATRWWEWDLGRLRQELASRPELLLRPSAFFGRPTP